MADNQTQNNNSVYGLSETDLDSLVRFKELLNTEIPQALPQEASSMANSNGLMIDENKDPYDSKFLRVVDSFVNNKAMVEAHPELQDVYDAYRALPQDLRSHIASYDMEYIQGNQDKTETQTQRVLNRAQNHAGMDEKAKFVQISGENGADRYVITPDFSEQFLKKVNDLKKQQDPNADEFTSIKQMREIQLFLDQVLRDNIEKTGVENDKFNSFLVNLRIDESARTNDTHLMILQNAALLDLAKLFDSGSLPSGAKASVAVMTPGDERIPVPRSLAEDRYFSHATYAALSANDKVDAKTFFSENSDNPNAGFLREAAHNLGIDTENGELTMIEVGQFARLMMKYQACKLGIANEDITVAFHEPVKTDCFEGRFLVNTDDAYLAALGGIDTNSALYQEAKATGMTDREILADSKYARELHKIQNDAWIEDFGELSQSAVDIKVAMKPFEPEQIEAMRDSLEDDVRYSYTLPHQFFKSYNHFFGDPSSTQYERDRQEYLTKIKGVFTNDPNLELVRGKYPASSFKDATETVDETSEKIEEFIKTLNNAAVQPNTQGSDPELNQTASLNN